jgi:hypothetical protein
MILEPENLPHRRMLMKKSLLLLLLLSTVAGADEGMWLPNQPPRDSLRKKYGFDLTDAFLERTMHASVRFNNGGSGGFVSPRGLVVTNHHIGADSLQKLSTKTDNLYENGFLAKSEADERKCPDLELNVLQEIVDVTARVQSAVKPDMPPAAALAARKSILAEITKESLTATGLRSDVVTLYQGGLYHLYRYKRYTDVRLVMAPEHAIAAFGGDVDNFEFPRWDLDVCFFRVYENGQPASTPNFFPWSERSPGEGDLVFVSGHPGTTNRLETYARLLHRRDHTLPYSLQMLRHREALLSQHAAKGTEQTRQASGDLAMTANARKALTGQFQGLLDPMLLGRKAAAEFSEYHDDSVGSPWDKILIAQLRLSTPTPGSKSSLTLEREYLLLEKGDAFDSKLFKIARHLVRLADELPKPDGQRLPEYRTSALESLKLQLFSPAPIEPELERVKLTGSLSFLKELGGDIDAFAKESPAQIATRVIGGTKLADVEVRKQLFAAGRKGIDASQDPMILFAKSVNQTPRQRFDELEEIQQQAYQKIAAAMFKTHGQSIPPDATFTLRLAFGVVKSYEEDGTRVPFQTTFAGVFARSDDHKNREPFALPPRWLAGKTQLTLTTPFNFVSTADTIGGNSGSPVLNRAGELVGVNFDRNRHGLVRNFVYTEEQARHISVSCEAVLHALRVLYAADALAAELTKR